MGLEANCGRRPERAAADKGCTIVTVSLKFGWKYTFTSHNFNF